MIQLSIAVTAPVHHVYSYILPAYLLDKFGTNPHQLIGRRAYVPFGNRTVTGYIMGIQTSEESIRELKEIVELLDETPLFRPNIIKLFEWVADYYHYPIGQVVQTALPGGLTVKSQHFICLTERADKDEVLLKKDQDKAGKWVEILVQDGRLSHQMSREVLKNVHDKALFTYLQKKGWAEIRISLHLALFK